MRDWGPEEAARSRGADTGQPALVLGNVDPDLPSPQRRFQRNLKPEREWSPASDGSSPQTPGFQPGRPRAGGRACGAPDPPKPARWTLLCAPLFTQPQETGSAPSTLASPQPSTPPTTRPLPTASETCPQPAQRPVQQSRGECDGRAHVSAPGQRPTSERHTLPLC